MHGLMDICYLIGGLKFEVFYNKLVFIIHVYIIKYYIKKTKQQKMFMNQIIAAFKNINK